MNFYNNIFASAFKCYDKYGKSPRFKAASFVFVCLLGSFFLLLSAIKKTFVLDFSIIQNYSGYKLLFVIIGFSLLGLVWKYYSKDKSEKIIKNFEEKPIGKRRIWGFISVITFILQWVVTAFLLSK
jgi:hypothetical protein